MPCLRSICGFPEHSEGSRGLLAARWCEQGPTSLALLGVTFWFQSTVFLKMDVVELSEALDFDGTCAITMSSCPQSAPPKRPPRTLPPGARRFTLRQRVVLRIIIWAGYWFIRLIGPTLRVSISFEDGAQSTLEHRPLIGSFWHSCLIPATYICRNLGVRVMSSNSYDGEYMGRIIHKFGFVAVKGSSSRNAVRALLGLRRGPRRRMDRRVYSGWPARSPSQSQAWPGRAGALVRCALDHVPRGG